MLRTDPRDGRVSRTSQELGPDSRPLLAPEVSFEDGRDGPWIVMSHGVPVSRVSRPVVELLTAMNGDTAIRTLHERFAAADSLETFLGLVERFRATGLLDGAARRQPGRLTFRPPFTVQVATLRAPALFRWLHRMFVPVPVRVILPVAAVLTGVGVVAAFLQVDDVLRLLTAPVPLDGLVVVTAVLGLITLLHEGAHGLALTMFGGEPRRAGVMLFYLAPAFFVDVTDGWRLGQRRQRVAIALAGPAVHAVLAALAFLIALVFPPSTAHRSLLLLAVSCVVVVVVNLIPFVRFDGYIALMSAIDEPNLRDRTIQDGTSFLSWLLFGGQRTGRLVQRWWGVPFGLASLLMPVALVVFAVARITGALAGGGPVLGVCVVGLETAVVVIGGVILSKGLLRVLQSGVSRLRFGIVCAGILACVAAVGALITVPSTASLGFVVRGEEVILVQGEDVDLGLAQDAPVSLTTRGVVASAEVGQGKLERRTSELTMVPLDALFPVTADGEAVPAVMVAVVDVSDVHSRLPRAGHAEVELGRTNLWQALWTAAVVTPLSPLWSEG